MSRRLLDTLLTVTAALAAVISLAAFAAIFGVILWRGLPAISWSFLTQETSGAGAAGGVVYQILGTALLVATACAAAIPIAAGVGIWLHTYSIVSLRRGIEAALQALNGIPSIVFGLLGFVFFFELLGLKKSWLAGGLLLALMILPTLVVAFLERLRAIPRATLLAAAGLGLRRGHIVRAVLLPQAAPGLVTGTLLGLARAAGETAPIMFTAAIFAGATVPKGVVDSPVLALPYHIFVLAQDSYEPAMTANVWGTAAVLVFIVTAMSALAIPLRMRFSREAAHD